MSEKTEIAEAPEKEENVLLNLLLNIALPAFILSSLSKEDRLGPLIALIVAIALPIGYGIYDFATRRNFNFFSVIGFISVLLTGGLGLMKASPFIFACKEAILPLLFATLILLTHLRKTPFIQTLLLNPQLINVKKLTAALDANDGWGRFRKLMFHCSIFLALTLCASSIANFFLAMRVLEGTEGGSPEYMKGIGKITWMGFLIIGVPMMVAFIGIFFYMMKGLGRITGMDADDLTNPGDTVRKKVKKGEVLSEEREEIGGSEKPDSGS